MYPDLELSVFITNLGKYNEGELVGEWVKLPVADTELREVLKRIGISSAPVCGNVYEEWFITDYDCSIDGITDILGEYESLDKLNDFMNAFKALDPDDQTKFMAVVSAGNFGLRDLESLIELVSELDHYVVFSDITDEYDLGYHYVHELGNYTGTEIESLSSYIDYEALGRDIAMDESGCFTEAGYLIYAG